MFTAEYVNIFGIPFTFLPHESDETGTAPTTPPKTQVEALRDRMNYEISWPNIIRIDREFKPETVCRSEQDRHADIGSVGHPSAVPTLLPLLTEKLTY